MPLYIVADDGSLLGWGDTGSPPDAPPAAPTGVTIDAGDGQVTISWATPAEGDVTEHRIRRVNSGGSTTLVEAVSMPALSGVVTGLTNGTEYTFVVRAVDGAGQASGNSAQVSATPVASSTAVKFGYNVQAPATLSTRLVKWGNRAPLVRTYGGTSWVNSLFNFTTGTHPERGAVHSWKAGGFSTSALAAGAGNSRVIDWLESIPGGANPWDVKFGFWHEPNSSSGMELPVADYLGIYEQLRICLDSATLQPGVQATLWANFMAYNVGDGSTNTYNDAWVPDPSICDGLSWDVYLNPGEFTSTVLTPNCPSAGGPEYGTSFPNTEVRHRDWMRATIRTGYAADGRWAIWEYNTPPRDYDGPANPDYVCGSNRRLRYEGGRTAPGHDATHTEVERAAALRDGIEYMLSRPTFDIGQLGLPDHFLIWEHPTGVNWNQKFYHDNVWNALKPYYLDSPGAL